MKHLKTRDQNSLILLVSVILTLIACNSPLFIKSLANSNFSFPDLQILANSLALSPLRQKEQALWKSLKEVDFQINERQGNMKVAENYSETAIQEDAPETILQVAEATEITEEETIANTTEEKEFSYQRFLLIGDSTMYDLGVVLNNDLRKNYGINNIRLDYRPSTGLNRKDYYNWHQKTPEFIESYSADVVIAIFGGNEDQNILDSQGQYHSRFSETWAEVYRERVEEYAQIIEDSSVKKMYWVGQPISNSSRFKEVYPVLNKIYREVSEKYDKIEFIDTWETFAVNGQFSPVMPDASGKKAYVRVSDGVHFTAHGANILGDLIVNRMAQDQVIESVK